MFDSFLDLSFLQTDHGIDWFLLFKTLFVSYVQGIFLFIGLIVCLLGAAILWKETFPSHNDRFFTAKIIGVRSGLSSLRENGRSPIYYPVFEYVDGHGKVVEAESLSGSSLLRNKFPGTKVKIKVDIETPDWASPVGMGWKIGGLIGILLGTGFILGGIFFQPITVITLLVWIIAAAKPLLKFKKVIIPKGERLSRFDFKIKRKGERDEERKKLPILLKEEILVLLRKEDRVQQIMFPFVVLIACGILYGGYFLFQQQQNAISSYSVSQATYVGHKNFPSRRLVFMTDKGVKFKVSDDFAGFYPSTATAETTKVFYDPTNPYKRVIDRGIWQGAEFKLLMGFGAFVLLQTLLSAIRRRSRLHRI